MNSYRNKSWSEYRREVIELDGRACVHCKKTEQDGAVLQVHHKRYISGLQPWEYRYEDCETVCKGCHAAEHGIIKPKVGWEYCGYGDLGDLIGYCEYCGSALRHAFYIFHDKWGSMQVGTDCCNNLTSSEIASNLVESQHRYNNRLKRFIESPRWHRSDESVQTIKQNKIEVEIVKTLSGYRIIMNKTQGKLSFPTLEAAKMKAFNVIESGEAKECLFRRKRWPA